MFKQMIISAFLISSFSWAHGPCKEDKEKFCKEAMGDQVKMAQCMKDHADQLSAECKDKKEEMKEVLAEIHEACAEDVKSLCPDVKPGGKRIMKCLMKSRDKVSDACKATLKEMKKHHHNKKHK